MHKTMKITQNNLPKMEVLEFDIEIWCDDQAYIIIFMSAKK